MRNKTAFHEDGSLEKEIDKPETVQVETGRIVSIPSKCSSIYSLYFETKWVSF